MELKDSTRKTLVTAFKNLIDSGGPGRIDFLDNDETLLAHVDFAIECMTINSKGVGTFKNMIPYMRGTVEAQGYVSKWTLYNGIGDPLAEGSCGNIDNPDKDIVFNTHDTEWQVNDVIVIEDLTLTVPPGSNNYLA